MARSTQEEQRASVTWLGHGTAAVTMAGTTLLTDPLLYDRVGLLRNRAPAVDGGLLDSVDAVLVSHEHYDHLHVRSLRRLGRDRPLVVPRGLGIWLVQRGFTNVHEVATGEQLKLGTVTVRATPAHHGDEPTPGRPRSERIGFLLESAERSVYFAGDTDLFDEMRAVSPTLDVALLPIWGWGREPGAGHLTPDTAAQALALLGPRVAVPIHWGTLRPVGTQPLPEARRREPAERFVEEARRLAPSVDVRVLEPGAATDVR